MKPKDKKKPVAVYVAEQTQKPPGAFAGFPARLERARGAYGHSYEGMARALGVSLITARGWAKGTVTPGTLHFLEAEEYIRQAPTFEKGGSP